MIPTNEQLDEWEGVYKLSNSLDAVRVNALIQEVRRLRDKQRDRGLGHSTDPAAREE